MLQVKNETPFVPGLVVLPDLAGIDTLYVAIKATFEIDATLAQARRDPCDDSAARCYAAPRLEPPERDGSTDTAGTRERQAQT